MLTLASLSDPTGPIARVTAKCPGSAEYISYINQASRKLLRRGDWPSTVVPIFVCVKQGCIVWPRYVGQVRKVNICNSAMPVRNLWYAYMDHTGACGGWNQNNWIGTWGGMLGPSLTGLSDQGRTSVAQDVMGEGRLIRAYARCQKDLGKTLTIFGTDNNGQPLQTRDSSGNWTQGITLTFETPFASTSTYVRHIDYVLKDKTQCIVDVYAYDAANDVLEDIAHYDGSETRPSYERTRLNMSWAWPSWSCGGSVTPNCCATLRGVMALVKLAFIPAENDDDIVIPDNEDAIEDMIESIKRKEQGDLAGAASYELSAVRELNRQSEDESPEYELSVQENTLGPGGMTNQMF